ncbi:MULTISPECIES: hypothetical protein [unclassified Paraburkholderia]|uniref:hypothetical protein n=1 Tax=unclassified Paraburkholderia TaxID=2615204 RepID=UPI001620DBE1|nr:MULTISPECIES: hypothetical protein [unclassified Paraburkholderia]MBB5445143.1 hypothetical protein [Paraburkholderia sp. WSM4177]MBB5485691.1 hypothetical protein [Paraburkholderia sp. WSM4180]
MDLQQQAMTEIEPLVAILLANKRSDLSKLCKATVITEDALGALISACDAGRLPWRHQISYCDFLPPNLKYTDEDSQALGHTTVGPLTRVAIESMAEVAPTFAGSALLHRPYVLYAKRMRWPEGTTALRVSTE